MYRVRFTKTASKFIRKLSVKMTKRIIEKAESLGENPRPADAKKLKATDDVLWRVRVGNYRIVYSIDDQIKIVKVAKVGHRKNIYE